MKPTKGKKWTIDEVKKLRVIRVYMSAKSMSEILGRTVNAINSKLREIDRGDKTYT